MPASFGNQRECSGERRQDNLPDVFASGLTFEYGSVETQGMAALEPQMRQFLDACLLLDDEGDQRHVALRSKPVTGVVRIPLAQSTIQPVIIATAGGGPQAGGSSGVIRSGSSIPAIQPNWLPTMVIWDD